MKKRKMKKEEATLYSPDKVKRGDISHFECVWLVTIELIDEPNNYEIEIILN